MAKFDVLSLFGVNVDFGYFNVFELIDVLGLRSRVLKTSRVANLIKQHGRKHHIVSVVIRQVVLSELESILDGSLLAYDPNFQESPITTSEYERRYEAEDKLILICNSLVLGKSVVSVRRLKGADFSRIPRELTTKGRSLYQYFRQILNDNTRDYVLSYKEGKTTVGNNSSLASNGTLQKPKERVTESSVLSGKRLSTEPVPFAKEIRTALSLMSQGVELVTEQVKSVFNGAPLAVNSLEEYCTKLSQSYDRNPHSILAVRHIQNTEEYTAQHSVACAILACHLAKSLQLDLRYVNVITLGALVFDLGRFKLPEIIAKKPGKLTDAEFQLTRKHLHFGEVILAAGENVPKMVYQMLWEHHERIDGSGYPQGKIDKEISIYGKIGAIVDAYDSLTSEQSHKKALTPTEALSKMNKESGLAFDKKLLSIFVESLGVVPVGSCVELSNGRLAFVLTLNTRLQPSLLRQVFSLSSKAFISPADMILDKSGNTRIAKIVSPSSYGLRFIDHIS
ncbi:HD-GYP domain-containing protein [Marinomonas atlantica]|uniref:HD-GYP domain-containing protein n=1 Tax=Marinomonas atlantica TaxID=1806668 RepID=UPI00082D8F2A|nr:HD domain-containing phosphohydrolase [Marinomonas atlantica]